MSPIDCLNDLIYESGKSESGSSLSSRYFLPIEKLSRGLPVPFLGVHVLIWQLREHDLRKRFSLKTKESRLKFLAWCVVHGAKEYRALNHAYLFWDALAKPAFPSCELTDYGCGISWLMVLAGMERSDLNFDLELMQDRERLCAWYLLHGRNEIGLGNSPLEVWQIHYLLGPSCISGLNRLQLIVYNARPDVQNAFPLLTHQNEYIQWFRNFVAVESNLIDALRTSKPSELTVRGENQLAFGVNVIGYAFGQLGIGEDARMAAKSLLAANVPMTMHNFPPGNNVKQSDRSMESYVSNEISYNVNMFCLTALEHGRYFAENGPENISGRYCIGYWPWELAQWPEEWRHLFSLVDEVWVSSRHTFDAVVPFSPVPVRLMPMAVEKPNISSLVRKDFNLPDGHKLFLFTFDLNSSAKRKNPKACIDAFMLAFPKNGKLGMRNDKVGLVIKVHPPVGDNKEWEELKSIRSNDARILIIEDTLSKEDLFSLYNECDCFLSLHRAEGFGRCIAEVMLLDKPVIVTAYSGNLSFNNQDNSLLVPWSPKLLGDDDYPFGKGKYWAEPDIAAAARQMRRIVNEPSVVSEIAMKGGNYIREKHGLKAVGQRYAAALKLINANM